MLTLCTKVKVEKSQDLFFFRAFLAVIIFGVWKGNTLCCRNKFGKNILRLQYWLDHFDEIWRTNVIFVLVSKTCVPVKKLVNQL